MSVEEKASNPRVRPKTTQVDISGTDSDAAHAACANLPGFLGIIGTDGKLFARFAGEIEDIDELMTLRQQAETALAAPISLGGPTIIQKPSLPAHPTFDDLVAAVRQLQGQTK